MFTGIVQALVPVQNVSHENDISRLTLDLGEFTQQLELGASVAVNGTCLTVTAVNQGQASFDVIVETLRTTNLGEVHAGSAVNIERSFRVGDEIGGHVVSGHVTGTSEIVAIRHDGHDCVVRLTLGSAWDRFVFHKGFVAVDGASLTISALDRAEGWMEISLIPETLARTTLGRRGVGEMVNIEVDSQSVATVETIERVMADPQWAERLASVPRVSCAE